MPITENQFTDAELLSAIEAKPELVRVVTKVLSGKKYNVMSETEKVAYDTESETRYIGNHTKKIAGEVESTVKELSGIEKVAGENWTDYYKRSLKTLKESENLSKAEITKLKSTTDLSAAERQRLQELSDLQTSNTTLIEKMKSEHTGEITKLKTGTSILNDVVAVRAKLSKDPVLQKAIEIQSKQVLKEMGDIAQIEPTSGKTIFVRDGKALTKDGNFLTAADIYSTEMADFIDKGKTQGGAGGNSGGEGAGVSSDVKTQTELRSYLSKKGLIHGSPQMTAEFNRLNGNSLPKR